jgi:hypothetical protein
MNPEKGNLLKNKVQRKPDLPKLGGNNTHENKVRTLRDQLLEVEKEIQMIKMTRTKKKTEELENEKLEKHKKRANSSNNY